MDAVAAESRSAKKKSSLADLTAQLADKQAVLVQKAQGTLKDS